MEDAVAPDAKDLARAQVVEEIQAGGYGNREVVVRHVTLRRTCRSYQIYSIVAFGWALRRLALMNVPSRGAVCRACHRMPVALCRSHAACRCLLPTAVC